MSITKFLFTSIFLTIFAIQNIKAQNSSIKTAGDIGLIIIPVTALTATLLQNDKKGTWQFTKSFLLNQTITYSLKLGINKQRPDLSNNNAFPSAHTSTTFQGASFIHRRYGFKYSIPAYIIASFTAFSRIEVKKHDGWDVLAGTIFGIGSSYIFTTPYKQEHIEFTFNSSEKNYQVGFKYKF